MHSENSTFVSNGHTASLATRRSALLTVSVGAMLTALSVSPAMAQSAADSAPAAPPAAAAEPAQQSVKPDIIVTGSRITASGFNAPTPTTVVGEDLINNNAQPNIFSTVVQLPSLQGSSGSSTLTYSTSSGQQGLSS
jgi:hypothetical protein